MTLHLHWLHAPRWLARAAADRAMALVLGIIGISLLFGAWRVLDAAVSGDLVTPPSAVAAPAAASMWTDIDPALDDACPIQADLVEIPHATADAISL